jgi:DNA-directed RNA polymerase II subunit RPB1
MAKASFEESLENFLKAGLNGERESTDGVSASIMLGKMPKTGTGVFDMLIDVQKLLQIKPEKKEEILNTPSEDKPKFVKKNPFFE